MPDLTLFAYLPTSSTSGVPGASDAGPPSAFGGGYGEMAAHLPNRKILRQSN